MGLPAACLFKSLPFRLFAVPALPGPFRGHYTRSASKLVECRIMDLILHSKRLETGIYSRRQFGPGESPGGGHGAIIQGSCSRKGIEVALNISGAGLGRLAGCLDSESVADWVVEGVNVRAGEVPLPYRAGEA